MFVFHNIVTKFIFKMKIRTKLLTERIDNYEILPTKPPPPVFFVKSVEDLPELCKTFMGIISICICMTGDKFNLDDSTLQFIFNFYNKMYHDVIRSRIAVV